MHLVIQASNLGQMMSMMCILNKVISNILLEIHQGRQVAFKFSFLKILKYYLWSKLNV